MEKRRAGISGIKYRNFRPGGRNFRWVGNLRGELPPKTSGTPPERKTQNDLAKIPRKISRTGTSGQEAGISGPSEISGGTSGEKFRDPSREESQNDLANFPTWPELPARGRNFRPPEFPPKGPELPVLQRQKTYSEEILFAIFDLFTFWAKSTKRPVKTL